VDDFDSIRVLCRTLGSIVCIIAERKNVHHSIISSLDSHDNVELEAAIHAASLFAAKSKYVPSRLYTTVCCVMRKVTIRIITVILFICSSCE